MLETAETSVVIRRAFAGALACLAAGCATQPPEPAPAPAPVVAQPQPPAAPPAPPAPDPAVVKLEEAKALLAQAETDVQRARTRRALWQKAWEDLLAARQAVAAGDAARA